MKTYAIGLIVAINSSLYSEPIQTSMMELLGNVINGSANDHSK